jgi:hypothetical protein
MVVGELRDFGPRTARLDLRAKAAWDWNIDGLLAILHVSGAIDPQPEAR